MCYFNLDSVTDTVLEGSGDIGEVADCIGFWTF